MKKARKGHGLGRGSCAAPADLHCCFTAGHPTEGFHELVCGPCSRLSPICGLTKPSCALLYQHLLEFFQQLVILISDQSLSDFPFKLLPPGMPIFNVLNVFSIRIFLKYIKAVIAWSETSWMCLGWNWQLWNKYPLHFKFTQSAQLYYTLGHLAFTLKKSVGPRSLSDFLRITPLEIAEWNDKDREIRCKVFWCLLLLERGGGWLCVCVCMCHTPYEYCQLS